MTVQRLKVGGVAIVCFAFLVAFHGTALAQNKCTSGEVNATGKKAPCKAAVFASAAARNVPADTAKLATCGARFSAGFAKASGVGGCASPVTGGTIETKVDNFVNDLNSEIAVGPLPSKCQGAKLKAAGKKARCLLLVDAKGFAQGLAPDSVKHAACGTKMSTAFAKSDGGTTCGTTSGDFATIEGKVDAFENDVLNEENPPPTATTSSTTTSMTSSSTTSTTRSSTTTTTMGPTTFVVHVGPSGTSTFSPASLTIKAGDTVLWVWDTNSHTVTSGTPCTADGKFCSPSDTNCAAGLTSSAGTMYRHTFTTTGTLPYFCATHCTMGMVGSITVQ